MVKNPQYLHLLGGVDVNPALYGQKRHPMTQRPNNQRDYEEQQAVREYVEKGLPIVGVCRGAQLLCVLAGGELWQHSPDHGVSHAIGIKGGFIPNCTAGHHQVMRLDKIPEEDYKVIAWCPYPTRVYELDNTEVILEAAPEIVYFKKLKALAIQPHPEWSYPGTAFRDYADELVHQYTGQEKTIFDFTHSYI